MKYSFVAFAIPLFILAACAQEKTPYVSSVQTGEGYIDRKIGDNKYEIQVTGNANTSYYNVENYFHRRAKELCNFSQYDYNMKRESRTKIIDGQLKPPIYIPTQTLELPMVTGEITCKKT